jgi:hypothetical protein
MVDLPHVGLDEPGEGQFVPGLCACNKLRGLGAVILILHRDRNCVFARALFGTFHHAITSTTAAPFQLMVEKPGRRTTSEKTGTAVKTMRWRVNRAYTMPLDQKHNGHDQMPP